MNVKLSSIRLILEVILVISAISLSVYTSSQPTITQEAVIKIISQEDIVNSIVVEPKKITFVATPGTTVLSEEITITNVGTFPILIDLANNMTTDLSPSIGTVSCGFRNWVYPSQTYKTRLQISVSPNAPPGEFSFNIYITPSKIMPYNGGNTSTSERNIPKVNEEGKDSPAGHSIATISGVCGKDYRLVSPKKARTWKLTITITSSEDEPIMFNVYEIIGSYPYNYWEQNLPSARGDKTCTLTFTLDPSKDYELWIRDAYAKPFTGTIEEEWS